MAYVRAIFVSLNESYPELGIRNFGSEALKNCTCGWWRIDPDNAKDVRYVVGHVHGVPVSVYRVIDDIESDRWPTIEQWPLEDGSDTTETRRYIPANRVTIPEWESIMKWPEVRMFGPIRYGIVQVDARGCLEPQAPEFDPLDTDS